MSLLKRIRELKQRLPTTLSFELELDSGGGDGRFIGVDPPEPAELSPASLPTAETRDQRARALAPIRARYRFGGEPGEPPHAATTPGEAEVPDATRSYIAGAFRRGRLNEAAAKLALSLDPPERPTVSVYDRLFKTLPRPRDAHLWSHDDYFAWLWLAGLGAGLLERLDELPAALEGCVEQLRAAPISGPGLDEALASGRLFAVDLSVVAELPLVPGRHLVSSISLFTRGGATDKLSPLAIVLDPGGPRQRAFSPRDPFWNWQTAKAYVLNAANLHHQALAHYFEAHQIVEILALALVRNLHPDHPVHRLLGPYLDHSIGINTVAREILINDTGLIEESMSSGAVGFRALIRRAWSEWRWDAASFEGSLERRGLADELVLADYPYRDDGRAYLDILREFVADYLGRSYATDAEVRDDPELSALMAELGDPHGGQLRGLPQLDSLDALVEFAAECVFKATGLHHAMQTSQYDEYGTIPAIAAALYAPSPAPELEVLSEADYLAALPKPDQALRQITTAWVLTRPTRESILDYAMARANLGPHPELHARLADELIGLSRDIRAAMPTRLTPYDSFDPQRVAARVEI